MRRLRVSMIACVLAASLLGGSAARAQSSPAEVRGTARTAIVRGDLVSAKATLANATGPDVGSAERAATAELLYVIDVWSASGRPRAATTANDAPMPDPEGDWEHAFANARAMLVSGHYAEAARRFDTLVGAAPDLVAGARAAELRALSREASPAVEPAPPPKRAAPAPSPPAAEAEAATETHWYGWQTLISDSVAIVTTPFVPPLGIGLYFLGAPLVHVLHLQGFRVLGSLGLRVIAPTVGLFVGLAAAQGCNGFLCELEGGAIGVLVGVGLAIAVDAALIAREEVPVEKKKNVTLVPLLGPGRVGVGGTF